MNKRQEEQNSGDPGLATTHGYPFQYVKQKTGLYTKLVSTVFIMVLMIFGLVAMPTFADHVPSVPVLDTGGHDQIDIGNGAQDDITVTIISPHGGFGWAWDETSLNGTNSLAACTYFQDVNGEVSAVCYSVDITNGVVDEEITTVFDCDNTGYDFDTLKCAGNSAISTDYDATCELGGNDPNNGVDPYFPQDGDNDLLVNCTITDSNGDEPVGLSLLNTCSKPSATESSASKDCVFSEEPAFLQLVKVVDGGTLIPEDWTLSASSGDFVFSTNGVSPGMGEPTISPIEVGTYVLSESNLPDYDLASLVCVTDGTTSTGDISATRQITVEAGTLTVCTFTNELATAKLTLVKRVINDNGGDADPTQWTLTANGTDDNDLSQSPVGPAEVCTNGMAECMQASTATKQLIAETFDLSESSAVVTQGYTQASLTCDGGNLIGSQLTLNPGDDVTCTFTNDDDAPSLTLEKVVINDNGGTAVADNWTLTAAGYDSQSPDAGTYDLSEVANAGTPAADGSYTLTSLICSDDSGTSVASPTVTLDLGEDVTCTFTNDDDAPSLTLEKVVINDNGGTAVADNWTLTAAGYDSQSPDAGTYDLSEVANAGTPAADGSYTLTSLVCSDDSGTSVASPTVTLDLGEDVTCTFTNDDDAPSLTLEKVVINDNGGTAVADNWTLTAAGYDSQSPDAGTYDLSEVANAGTPAADGSYTLTSLICSDDSGTSVASPTVTLDLGEDVTCTFTNDDDCTESDA